MVQMYYRDADAAVMCFDVSSMKSYESINYWVDQVRMKSENEGIVIGLAGNKCDLSEDLKVVNYAMA